MLNFESIYNLADVHSLGNSKLKCRDAALQIFENFYNIPNKEDSSSVLCGIWNPKCVCYMISCLMQLYMIPKFRNVLFQCVFEEDENSTMSFKQLQLLFARMQNGSKSYVSINDFCSSFKDLNGNGTSTQDQQDASEFLNLLLDRMLTDAKDTILGEFLANNFKGTLINKLKCDDINAEKVIEESFFMLCVPVKLSQSMQKVYSFDLNASLAEFTKSENIEYSWEGFANKTTQKRSLLKKVPNFLCFHLKRFDFDFRCMQRCKLNDKFTFPENLDIKPFCCDIDSNDGESSSDINSTISNRNDYNQLVYRLSGVVLHVGTAYSGHYYSIVRNRENDSKGDGDWIEFNDHAFKTFNISDLADSCFGDNGKEYSDAPLRKGNAFILVYERATFTNSAVETKVLTPTVPFDLHSVIIEENNRFKAVEEFFDVNRIFKSCKSLKLFDNIGPISNENASIDSISKALQLIFVDLYCAQVESDCSNLFGTLCRRISSCCSSKFAVEMLRVLTVRDTHELINPMLLLISSNFSIKFDVAMALGNCVRVIVQRGLSADCEDAMNQLLTMYVNMDISGKSCDEIIFIPLVQLLQHEKYVKLGISIGLLPVLLRVFMLLYAKLADNSSASSVDNTSNRYCFLLRCVTVLIINDSSHNILHNTEFLSCLCLQATSRQAAEHCIKPIFNALIRNSVINSRIVQHVVCECLSVNTSQTSLKAIVRCVGALLMIDDDLQAQRFSVSAQDTDSPNKCGFLRDIIQLIELKKSHSFVFDTVIDMFLRIIRENSKLLSYLHENYDAVEVLGDMYDTDKEGLEKDKGKPGNFGIFSGIWSQIRKSFGKKKDYLDFMAHYQRNGMRVRPNPFVGYSQHSMINSCFKHIRARMKLPETDDSDVEPEEHIGRSVRILRKRDSGCSSLRSSECERLSERLSETSSSEVKYSVNDRYLLRELSLVADEGIIRGFDSFLWRYEIVFDDQSREYVDLPQNQWSFID